MFNMTKLFKNKKVQHEIGDRVNHRSSNLYGEVTGVSEFKTAEGVKIPTISVRFNDGSKAVMLPANEFINLTRSAVKD